MVFYRFRIVRRVTQIRLFFYLIYVLLLIIMEPYLSNEIKKKYCTNIVENKHTSGGKLIEKSFIDGQNKI